MYGYGGGITAWCHVVRAGHFVQLFACIDEAFWKSKDSRDLKEYYMVHASEGSLEVGVGRVDVYF